MRANERHNERENYKFLKCNVPSAAKGHVRTKRDKRGREREGEGGREQRAGSSGSCDEHHHRSIVSHEIIATTIRIHDDNKKKKKRYTSQVACVPLQC